MSITTVFTNNRSQAVRLPDGVKKEREGCAQPRRGGGLREPVGSLAVHRQGIGALRIDPGRAGPRGSADRHQRPAHRSACAQRGRFVWPQASSGGIALTLAQLSMLLEGTDRRMPVRTHLPDLAA